MVIFYYLYTEISGSKENKAEGMQQTAKKASEQEAEWKICSIEAE